MILNPKMSSLVAPETFNGIRGNASNVTTCLKPEFTMGRSRSTPAKSSGLRYQRKVEKWLKSHYGEHSLFIGQWLEYRDASGRRYAQPDAWVIGRTKVALFEIKVGHSELAWWQLKKLYLPLLAQLYELPVVPVEIVKSYDPLAFFPGPHSVVFTPDELKRELVQHRDESVVVFQCQP